MAGLVVGDLADSSALGRADLPKGSRRAVCKDLFFEVGCRTKCLHVRTKGSRVEALRQLNLPYDKFLVLYPQPNGGGGGSYATIYC